MAAAEAGGTAPDNSLRAPGRSLMYTLASLVTVAHRKFAGRRAMHPAPPPLPLNSRLNCLPHNHVHNFMASCVLTGAARRAGHAVSAVNIRSGIPLWVPMVVQQLGLSRRSAPCCSPPGFPATCESTSRGRICH